MQNNWERYGHLAIGKASLKVGHYYAGKCRNAFIARWDGEKFIHWREKFDNVFLEDIEYWDLEGKFDGFIPLFWLGEELPKPINIELYNSPYKIIVNGVTKNWKYTSISYEDICKLEGIDPERNPSITIAYPTNDNFVITADRVIMHNQHVTVVNGCVVNAMFTGNG